MSTNHVSADRMAQLRRRWKNLASTVVEMAHNGDSRLVRCANLHDRARAKYLAVDLAPAKISPLVSFI